MRVPEVIEQARLGAILKFSNGQPKPPARFKRKLAAWEQDNSMGQLTEIHRPYKSAFRSYPHITLKIASYTSKKIEIAQFYRSFSMGSPILFTIFGIPDPGTVLVLRHQKNEHADVLLHHANSRTDAEAWLSMNRYPPSIIQEIQLVDC